MDLFLDANVFLSFYHFGSDDIETMHKVVKLINDGEIRLFSNQQLNDEVERNRHNKIFDGMKGVRSIKFGAQFPIFFRDYSRYKELSGHLKSANRVYKEILEEVDEDIAERRLAADNLIKEIFAASTHLDQSEILSKARIRVELGNPPGKRNSIGDAIHWECLLDVTSSTMHIVSQDGDFGTPLRQSTINPFLEAEWYKTRGNQYARVILHETLSAFLKQKFPDFELSVEAQKDEAIEKLLRSESFSMTHQLIAEISQNTPLTAAQSRRLCHCLVSNNQVYLIAKDPDVQELFKTVKDKAWVLTDDSIAEQCDEHLGWRKGEMSFPF